MQRRHRVARGDEQARRRLRVHGPRPRRRRTRHDRALARVRRSTRTPDTAGSRRRPGAWPSTASRSERSAGEGPRRQQLGNRAARHRAGCGSPGHTPEDFLIACSTACTGVTLAHRRHLHGEGALRSGRLGRAERDRRAVLSNAGSGDLELTAGGVTVRAATAGPTGPMRADGHRRSATGATGPAGATGATASGRRDRCDGSRRCGRRERGHRRDGCDGSDRGHRPRRRPRGPAGPQGPPGRDARVTCTTRTDEEGEEGRDDLQGEVRDGELGQDGRGPV